MKNLGLRYLMFFVLFFSVLLGPLISLGQRPSLLGRSSQPQASAPRTSGADFLIRNMEINAEGGAFAHPGAVQIEKISTINNFDLIKVTLRHRGANNENGAGDIRFTMKGPAGFLESHRKYASLFVVSGFFTGQESAELLDGIPETIIIGYEYPFRLEQITQDLAKLAHVVRLTPGQIALGLSWIARQPWSNQEQVSVMGVSLGGIFLPAGLHIAQRINVNVLGTIFVGTGSDIRLILRENLRENLNDDQLNAAAAGVELVLIGMQVHPKIHLSALRGPFLVISSDNDTVIPPSATAVLFESLQGEKTQKVIIGPHITPERREMIAEIREVSAFWIGQLLGR